MNVRLRQPLMDLAVCGLNYRRHRCGGVGIVESVRRAWWVWREIPRFRSELYGVRFEGQNDKGAALLETAGPVDHDRWRVDHMNDSSESRPCSAADHEGGAA